MGWGGAVRQQAQFSQGNRSSGTQVSSFPARKVLFDLLLNEERSERPLGG